MTDYTKTTDFTSKDSLPSGDSGKIIRGAEFGTEFDNIQTAVNSKSNIDNPAFTGNITVTGTVDGRDIAADGTKLDTIETSADVTDTANVTAAGAVMDSELTDITAVKALNQGVATTDSPTFAAVTSTGNVTVGGTVDGRDVAADGTKLDTVETNADVTDTANVTAAGALMDSEVTNLDQVKAFDSSDYATAAQGTTADNALPKTGGAMTGAITTNSTFDGRDVATDGTKLDGIEASADVTDTTNVTAAGALMDSELTSEASVKALNQGVATTDSPTFAGVTANGTVEFDGLSGTGAVTVTDILDQDDMSGNSATALATQQSIKAYVDSQVGTVDTLAEVLANGNATGGTDIAFGDNDKALFGAGSDLQIYHDGGTSVIADVGTGFLALRGDGNVTLQNAAGTENKLVASSDGAVTLYYDNAVKLATTSTGIDVSGTAAMDGLTIATGATGLITTYTGSSSSRPLKVSNYDGDFAGSAYAINAESSGGEIALQTATKDRIKVGSGGDISFYEDTGTTPKLFWDASAESLGIGTSSPNSNGGSNATVCHIHSSGTGAWAVNHYTNGTTGAQTSDGFLTGIVASDAYLFNYESGNIIFGTSNAEVARIDASGNVGIGTSSPQSSQKLHIANTSGNCEMTLQSSDSGVASLLFGDATDFSRGKVTYDNSNDSMAFQVNNLQEAMRIDSSGNVGIGTSNPSSPLHISNSGNSVQLRMQRDASNYWGFQLTGGNLNFQDIGSSTTPLSIDSSGNLAINRSSAAAKLDVNLGASGDIAIFRGSDSDTFTIDSDGSGINLDTRNTTTGLTFQMQGANKMRLDSSGNLLVGTTDTDTQNNNAGSTADNGFAYNIGSGGYLNVARYGGTVAYFNRTSTDGAIADFRKDGATVGSIRSQSGLVTDIILDPRSNNYATGHGIGGTQVSGVPKIIPRDGSGSALDGGVDLGHSNNRFKDLFLSNKVHLQYPGNSYYGRVQIDSSNNLIFGAGANGAERMRILSTGGITFNGDTAQANALDDYEEGTFTVTFASGVTSPTYVIQDGSYVKIGKLVTFQIRIELSAGTANGSHIKIGGLPFTSTSASSYGGAFFNYSQGFITDIGARTMHIGASATLISFYKTDGGQLAGTEVDDLTSTLLINGQYEVS